MATATVPHSTDATIDFTGILKNTETYAPKNVQSSSDRINKWFDDLMIQSGLNVSPSVILLLSFASSLTTGGSLFVYQENLLTAAIASFFGFLIPVGVVVAIRSRRQMQMMHQLPTMIEELARAARTGRSVEHCLQLVAEETKAPLGPEIYKGVRRMQMGMDVPSALTSIPHETGLVSLSILVTALCVHQETGGDLVSVLERLSRTLHDRLQFLGRLRAATTSSRATAVLMLGLPPLIFAFFLVRDPNYFNDLMASNWGKAVTILAVFLDFIGSVWILRILKTSQRA